VGDISVPGCPNNGALIASSGVLDRIWLAEGESANLMTIGSSGRFAPFIVSERDQSLMVSDFLFCTSINLMVRLFLAIFRNAL